MTTYKITANTNAYIANRDAAFNGRTEITLDSGLTIKEAKKVLLDLYNQKYSFERPYAQNWGLAVIQSRKSAFGASPTFRDGTRSFDFDGRTYKIEEEIIMNTLEELRDYINANEDWQIEVNEIIAQNGWTDDTGEAFGICNDGKRRLQFDENMIAEILDI